MRISSDLLSTIIGGVVGVGEIAQVAVGQLPPGTSMHAADYKQLGLGILAMVAGWLMNKKFKHETTPPPNAQ